MDVEYVLRIILRARDEMATAFKAAREQIKGMGKDTRDLNNDFDKVNRKITSLNNRFGNLTTKIRETQEHLRLLATGSAEDMDKLDKAIDKTTDSIARQSKAARAAIGENKNLDMTFDRLVDKQAQLRKEFEDGSRSRKDYIEDLKILAKEARAAQTASGSIGSEGVGDVFRNIRRDAEQAYKSLEQQDKRRGERLKGLRKDAEDAEKAVANAVKGSTDETRKSIEATEKRERATAELNKQTEETINGFRRYNANLGRTNQLTVEQSATLRRYQSDLQKLSRQHAIGSDGFRALSRAQETLRDRLETTSSSTRSASRDSRVLSGALGTLSRDTRQAGSGLDRMVERLNRMSMSLTSGGDNVAKLDNNLRGLMVLAVLVFAQQLITVLGGLGGELVAVAGSAVMAGGALGGMAAAGVAQALPAIGLLVAAFSRLKTIMEAFQQSQLVQQQQFQRNAKGQDESAKSSDGLANAQDSLRSALDGVANAHQRVTDAVENLTRARADGRRELEDLILSEKRAELQARGATLSQAEAQDALRQALQRGETGVAFQQREVAVSETRLGTREATVTQRRAREDLAQPGGNVENLRSVQQAKRAVDDAKRGVEDAQRAVDRARRGIDQARRSAQAAESSYFAGAEKLNFLLSQLSPAEKRLYNMTQRIYKDYRRVFLGVGTRGSGILGTITDAFTRGVETADRLMRDRRIISAAQGMSTGIAAQIDKVRIAFTRGVRLDQLLRVFAQARDNLAPLGTLATRVGKIFLNIAEAAGPAFHRFIGFVSNLVLHFLKLTDNRGKLENFFNTAERHLESWVKLTVAVVRFFAVLTGAGAPEGKKGIDDLTDSLNSMTDRMEKNRAGLQRFFRDARRVTDSVLAVLRDLAKEVARSFNPGSVEGFSKFLRTTFIPALGAAIRATGALTSIWTHFFSLPLVSTLVKAAITMMIFTKVVTGVAGALSQSYKQMAHFLELVASVPKTMGKGALAVQGFGDRLLLQKRLGEMEGKTGRLTAVMGRLGPVFQRAGMMIGRAVTFAFGPWGAAIAAVILGIYLLDRKFHFLEPTFNWLKGAFKSVIDWVRHYWPLLLVIISGPFAPIMALIMHFRHDIWDGIVGGAKAVLNFFKDHWLDALILTFTGPFGLLFKWLLSHLPKRFRSAGGDMASGLWHGLTNALGDFFGGIGGWINKHIIQPFLKFLGISSPSSVFKRLGKDVAHGFVEGVKSLPGLLWDAITGLADKFLDVGKKIADFIRKGIEKVPGGKILLGAVDKVKGVVANIFGGGKQQGGPIGSGYGGGDRVHILAEEGEHMWTKEEVRAIGGHGMLFLLRSLLGGGRQSSGRGFQTGGGIGQGLTPVTGRSRTASFAINVDADVDDKAHKWRLMWQQMVDSTRRNTALIEAQIRDMRVAVDGTLSRLKDQFTAHIVDMEMSAKVHLKRLSDSWSDTFSNISKLTYDGLFYMAHETNKALTGMGGKHVDFKLTRPTHERKATGGPVPGSGYGDTVPALLTPGEHVWTKREVERAGGHNVMYALRRMFGGGGQGGEGKYAAGGHVALGNTGRWVANTQLAKVILALMRKFHFALTAAGEGGHASNSDHHWGGAIDIVPGKGGSWGLLDRLAKLAGWRPNRPMPAGGPFRWIGWNTEPGHGEGNHLHLSWRRGGPWTGPGVASDFTDNIKRLIVKGDGGGLHDLLQKMFDRVRKAANDKISDALGDYDTSSTPLGKLIRGGAGEKIFDYMVRRGFSDAQAAGWVGVFKKESGFSTTIGNKAGSGATGLAQWLGGRLAALKSHKNWTSLLTQLNFVWDELMGPERGAYEAIKQAHSPEEAARVIDSQYERSDGLLSAPEYAQQAYDAFADSPDHGRRRRNYATGGVVRGPMGQAVNAVIHAGEWVVNKYQQSRLAKLLKTSPEALRGMLGFYGGRGSYAGGGEVEDKDTAPLYTSQAERERIERLKRGVYALPMLPLETWTQIVGEMRRVFHAINLGGRKIRRSLGRDLDDIDKLTAEGGLFDTMEQQRQDRATERTTRTQIATLQRRHMPGAAGWVVKQIAGPQGQADRALSDARLNLSDMFAERGDITTAMTVVNKRLADIRKDGKVSKSEAERFARLTGQQVGLKKRLQDISGEIGSGLSAVFEAQVAQQQAAVDDINKRSERKIGAIDLFGRIAQATGNDTLMDRVNDERRKAMASQAKELEGRIQKARAAGATDLADQLETQVSDLRMQIFEGLQQDVQTTMDRINQKFQRRGTLLDFEGRIADVRARFGAGGLGGMDPIGASRTREDITRRRGDLLRDQRGELNQLLQSQMALPEMQRNQTVIKALTDQIGDLDTSIVENTAAQREATAATKQALIEAITSRQAFLGGTQGTLDQILEALSQNQPGDVSLTNRRIDIAQQTLTTLVGSGRGLRDQLVEQFGIDLRDLSPVDLVDAISKLDFDSIETNMSEPDKQRFESLIGLVGSNVVETIGVQKKLDDLKGIVQDPQQFTTTGWQWFGQAIFNGMNQLLPQYVMPSTISGNATTKFPAPSITKPPDDSGNNGATQYNDIDINYHEVSEAPSGLETANRVGWEMRNANTQR